MRKWNLTITLTVVAVLTAARVSSAAQTVRTMYVDALAKEQAVRKALDNPAATDVLLKAVREVVASYDAVVRRYPTSSYCDDALWNAAQLELEAFAKFAQQSNKDTASRLFARLAAAYPASKFVRQIPRDAAPRPASAETPRATEPAAAAEDRAPRTAEPRSTAGTAKTAVPQAGSIAVIKAIRRTPLPDGVRVTIELDGEVQFHDDRIADPDRVFVDLSSTRAAPQLVDQTLRFDDGSNLVRQIRIGRHPNHTTRIVLDAGGVSSYSIYPLYGPYRLVIDCTRSSETMRRAANRGAGTTMRPTAPRDGVAPIVRDSPPPALRVAGVREPAALPARRVAADATRLPSMFPRAALLIAEARLEQAPPGWSTTAPRALTAAAIPPVAPPIVAAAPALAKDDATAARTTTPPPANVAGVSIARQLGLGVSRIVNDPGQGGHDPGAHGKGVTEAEVVLDVALRLEKLLGAQPGVEVILTRRTDDFIPLPERTAIANREGADLFLSIHANASPSPQARGIETYFLDFANNLSEAAVASRENAASGQTMGALPDFVKAIALNNKLDESRDFAAQVQRSMMEELRGPNKTIRSLGVKQAPFVVLIGAAMPSVLAEISFVTNPQEAKLLKTGAYRQHIAEALFNAIQKYQRALHKVQAVAPPE
jgi:N-acetylmuramoyl-L-alanine amidase